MRIWAVSAKAGATVASILGGLAVSHSAVAQGANRVIVDVTECINLVSPEDRYACYEHRVAEAVPQNDATASPRQAESRDVDTPLDRPETPSAEAGEAAVSSAEPDRQVAPDVTPDADESRSRRRAEPAVDARPNDEIEPEDIIATVTELRQTVPNSYVITLDNGQVWRQRRPKRYPMRPGQAVKIYPSRWGNSFRLTAADLNGFIEVERIR
jgi:hypothetical protein